MSIILQPQRSFPIVRQIANHLDATSYFVQAIIRDAAGNILDTVNLDAKGSQRYQSAWQVVADPSGQGRYISIVTSVYTDSGYTTKSENYGDEETTYLVFDRVMPSIRGGGGGLDSGTTRRIVSEELGKIVEKIPKPKKVKIPEQKDYEERLQELATSVAYLSDLVEKLPTEKTSVQPVLTGLQTLAQIIQNKEVTPETDLSPVLMGMEELKETQRVAIDTLSSVVEDLGDTIPEKLRVDLMNRLAEVVESASFTIEPTQAKMNAPEPPKEEAVPFDINQLAQ